MSRTGRPGSSPGAGTTATRSRNPLRRDSSVGQSAELITPRSRDQDPLSLLRVHDATWPGWAIPGWSVGRAGLTLDQVVRVSELAGSIPASGAMCNGSLRNMVGVAQLVERWTVTPDVAGSTPVTHPKASAAGFVRCLRPGCSVGNGRPLSHSGNTRVQLPSWSPPRHNGDITAPSFSGQGRCPFTAETRVRIPLGSLARERELARSGAAW